MRTPPAVCRHGHQMTPENLYVHEASGKWFCRTCQRERAARSYAKQKARNAETRKREREEFVAAFPQPSDIELAWAAGMFEGEGTATISDVRRQTPRPLVTLTNTDPVVTEFFHERWGGVLRATPKAGDNARDVSIWTLNAAYRISIFAAAILPFVRRPAVRRKLEILIEYHDEAEQGSRDPEYRAKRQVLMEEMRDLNRRGKR